MNTVIDESRSENVALWFDVEGDLRFLSHRDTLRCWQRALTRAEVPLRYSQGFNPHPRLVLCLPRTVGMAAADDLLLVGLTEPLAPDELEAKLTGCLPEGIRLRAAGWFPASRPRPRQATIEVDLADSVDDQRLSERCGQLADQPSWPVRRPPRRRHPGRTVDLKERIRDLHCRPGRLQWRLDLTGPVAARIAEVLELLGLDGRRDVRLIRRTEVDYAPAPVVRRPVEDER